MAIDVSTNEINIDFSYDEFAYLLSEMNEALVTLKKTVCFSEKKNIKIYHNNMKSLKMTSY